ncbi:ATP-grasp domain-containing protein [Williamsia soli]|uniref:ATP-grasp domain-containing protein n=1 Tax=Williamsia soli TaxID=364929 RepID=UPI001A9F1EAA|nr:ATP-grasp domain-containing protein [Williamsia soli]
MSTRSGKNVLITFGRSFLTLELARLMNAGGHNVFIADSMRFPISRFSNSVQKVFRVPRPKFEPREYVDEIARLVRAESIDLVIPIHEETDILAMAQDQFPPECELLLSDFLTENRLHNKFEYQVLLDSLGIPTLKYAQVRSAEELAALDFDRPFALKQVYSRGSQQVYKVNPGEVPEGLEFDPLNPWLAQEWLKGDKYCTYSVCHRGKVYAHTVYPVRYAINGQSCLSFEPVVHPGINDWVERRVKDINFTGQIGFDFIEHPDRGLYTIECNPRSTSGILMFEPHNRVDRAFFGENDEVITPDPDARKMLGPGMLLYGWRKSALEGNTLRGFARDYRRTDEVISQRDDIGPLAGIPLAMGNILLNSMRYKVGLAEGFMHDHEWDGQQI